MNTGKRWLSQLILKLWEVSWDMWEHRNGVLMDKEKGLIVLQLNEDIHHEYALGFHGFPPNMRHQVRRPIDEVLEMEMKDKHTWLGRGRTGLRRH